MSRWPKILRNLSWLTQLGLSIITPPILCLGLAFWLIQKKGAPGWIMILAFVFGLGAAGVSFYKFLRIVQKKSKPPGKDSPPAFNKHK